MTNAFVIETSNFTAGIVTGERAGFRFYAAHRAMASLEGTIYRSPQAAQVAAERLVESNRRRDRKHVPYTN